MAQFEVVCIGNELLDGFTVNTNGAEIGQLLHQNGYHCSFQQMVPDDPQVVISSLESALNRSNLVVCSGGLGPTVDDRTRRALAQLFETELVFNQEVADHLEKRYGSQLPSMENQATVPQSAQVLLNPVGTAPGLLLKKGSATLVVLPGVPHEMRALLKEQALPYLLENFPPEQRTYRRVLNGCRHTESMVNRYVEALKKQWPQLDFGIYPAIGTVSIHLLAREASQEESEGLLDGAEAELKRYLGKYFYPGEHAELQGAIQARMQEQGLSLSTAESCTGGAIAAAITRQPGSSGHFVGSVVAYSNELKAGLLGVPRALLEREGAVSEAVVKEMALGIKDRTGSDYSLAVSGVAGPGGGSPSKPVGTVWMAIALPNGEVDGWLLQAKGRRSLVIRRGVTEALSELWLRLADSSE